MRFILFFYSDQIRFKQFEIIKLCKLLSFYPRINKVLIIIIIIIIIIHDIFFALNEIDICNLVDDTTPYVCDSNSKSVLEKLEHNSELADAWFEMNYMKLNNDICHLLISV